MAESRGNLDIATVLPGGCFAEWRAGVPCDAPWTGVIETIGKPGYGQFCARHLAGYRRFNAGGEFESWREWSRAEWESSGRAAELEAQIAAQAGKLPASALGEPE